MKNDEELIAFYSNSAHWNSIANLHLLNDSQNISKGAKHLDEWIGSSGVTVNKKSLLLDDTISLKFEEFMQFYEHRRAALKERLMSRVYMTEALVTPIEGDSDEEVVEEVALL